MNTIRSSAMIAVCAMFVIGCTADPELKNRLARAAAKQDARNGSDGKGDQTDQKCHGASCVPKTTWTCLNADTFEFERREWSMELEAPGVVPLCPPGTKVRDEGSGVNAYGEDGGSNTAPVVVPDVNYFPGRGLEIML